MSDTLTINELTQQARVSTRTVRYYVAQGLLPPPEGAGRAAVYRASHLGRLHLIRQLQEKHLPLAEIRHRLEAMNEEIVQQAGNDDIDLPTTTVGRQSQMPRPSAHNQNRSTQSRTTTRNLSSYNFDQSNWQRLSIAPDIEIHVQRPLSRLDNRRLSELLEAARAIFPHPSDDDSDESPTGDPI